MSLISGDQIKRYDGKTCKHDYHHDDLADDQDHNITYELNVSNSCPKSEYVQESHFMRIPVDDNYTDKLLPYFNRAFQFLGKYQKFIILSSFSSSFANNIQFEENTPVAVVFFNQMKQREKERPLVIESTSVYNKWSPL